ncbi:MAG: biotin transporter BioY [Spirochaetales bacterium]|nr:biotin transporter BioY [Spirochaetales bacterium]
MSRDSTNTLRYATRVQTGALAIALITAGAFVAIPIPGSPVPIVLQNMFVVLAGVILPPGWAALSVGVYLLLGAVGLPVLAGATGGLAPFAGPTGGFLAAFPISAALTSWILHPHGVVAPRTLPISRRVIAIVTGFIVVYLLGVPWLARVANLTFSQALGVGMVPFLPGDALKAIVLIALMRTLPDALWRTLS